MHNKAIFRGLLSGARDGNRTHDLLITNQLLYRLSHSSNFKKPKLLYRICAKRSRANCIFYEIFSSPMEKPGQREEPHCPGFFTLRFHHDCLALCRYKNLFHRIAQAGALHNILSWKHAADIIDDSPLLPFLLFLFRLISRSIPVNLGRDLLVLIFDPDAPVVLLILLVKLPKVFASVETDRIRDIFADMINAEAEKRDGYKIYVNAKLLELVSELVQDINKIPKGRYAVYAPNVS